MTIFHGDDFSHPVKKIITKRNPNTHNSGKKKHPTTRGFFIAKPSILWFKDEVPFRWMERPWAFGRYDKTSKSIHLKAGYDGKMTTESPKWRCKKTQWWLCVLVMWWCNNAGKWTIYIYILWNLYNIHIFFVVLVCVCLYIFEWVICKLSLNSKGLLQIRVSKAMKACLA